MLALLVHLIFRFQSCYLRFQYNRFQLNLHLLLCLDSSLLDRRCTLMNPHFLRLGKSSTAPRNRRYFMSSARWAIVRGSTWISMVNFQYVWNRTVCPVDLTAYSENPWDLIQSRHYYFPFWTPAFCAERRTNRVSLLSGGIHHSRSHPIRTTWLFRSRDFDRGEKNHGFLAAKPS